MDPIRPIGAREPELEQVYRVERPADERRREREEAKRRERRRPPRSRTGDEPPDDGHTVDFLA